ncbi:MAG: manganese efflux pump [Clostridia bacterium]|nr:manganese efflux pump [Clostridia bacterium]
MFINSLVLAFTSSIDSLGIGITYGIKKTKITLTSKIILFIISFVITNLSILVGNIIRKIFSENVSFFIGNSILILIGFFIIATSNSSNKNSNYDFNNSNLIDPKEALALGIALSLDSFCIGVGISASKITFNIFPLLVSIFQFIFLSIGNLVGNKINSFSNFSNKTSSIISGILLILIGILKFV